MLEQTPNFCHYHALTTAHNELSKKIEKAGAVLRLMKFRCVNTDRLSEQDGFDMAALVDVCLDALPHHYGEEIDAIDTHGTNLSRDATASYRRADTLARIVDLIGVACGPHATLEVINEIANAIHKIVGADSQYAPQWLVFAKVMAARGFLVEMLWVKNICLGPEVITRETRRTKRKEWKSMNIVAQTVTQSQPET